MPQFQITTETSLIAFIGIFLFLGGVLFFLFGVGVIRSGEGKDISFKIESGKKTTVIGSFGMLIGMVVIFWSTSTSEPISTSTPTPTTSETQQASIPNLATIDIYDSFDNPTHNGYFNQALWVTNIQTGDVAIFQENGRLTFQTVDSNNGLGSWINLVDGTGVPLKDYNAIEVKFSWDPQINGQLYLGLTAEQSWSPKVAYICDFIIASDASLLKCEGIDEEQIHSPSDRVLASNRVYTLRFEIDPTTATFVIYLDGTVIDTYIPPNPEKWLQGTVSYNIHLGAEPNSSATTYIDEARFGRIK